MRFNLFKKIMVSHLAVILTVIFILSGVLSAVVENFLYKQKIRELKGFGEQLVRIHPLSEDREGRDIRRLQILLSGRDIRILRLDREGRVIGPRRGLENFQLDPALMERIRRGQMVEGRDEIGRLPVTWVILPHKRDGVDGAWVLFSPIEGLNRALRQIRFSLILAAIAALIISLLVGGGFAKRMSDRIRGLRRATERIRRGRYDVEAPPFRVRSRVRRDELDELAMDFHAMAEELSRSRAELARFEERRRQFISDVSHELRTPLTSIRGLLEGLRTGVVEDGEKERIYSLMEKETLRLIRLINELLDLERIRSGKVELKKEWHQVEDLFEIVTEQMQPLASEKGIRLTSGGATGIRVYGDYDRLLQILVNLVQNGIQFTEEGEVRLTAASAEGFTILRVEDTGAGMSPEELEKIWDRFFKADPSRTRRGNETGLGLSIVKRLTEAHGGIAEVESRPGDGSSFTLKFPVPDPKETGPTTDLPG
jgi:signal transduction histidine kinase